MAGRIVKPLCLRLALTLLLAFSSSFASARDAGEFLASSKAEEVAAVVPKAEGVSVDEAELYVPSGGYRSGPHSYTYNTKPKSFLDEVKDAAVGFIIGIVLVCLAYPVLWYNEKRQVHMEQIFGYARKVVKTDLSADNVSEEFQSNVVHVTGTTSTEQVLTDSEFSDVSVTNCAHLQRSVEMYQWKETSTKKDDKVTYSYEKTWSSLACDSSSFHESGYNNPPFPFDSKKQTADPVNFGEFVLPVGLVNQMVCSTSLDDLPSSTSAGGRDFALQGDCYVTNQGSPEVGDMRVTFSKVPCGPASVVAVQAGNTFAPLSYDLVPASGCCSSVPEKVELPGGGLNAPLLSKSTGAPSSTPCGCVGACIEMNEHLFKLTEKEATASEVISEAEAAQGCVRCCLTFLGYFMFFIGFYLQFSFVPVLFKIIPFIGVWITWLGKFLAMGAAFFIGCFCWCGTIAASWIVHRPLYGILLASCAVAMIAGPTYIAEHDQKFD